MIELKKCLFPCRWWQLPYFWAGIKMYDLVAGRQMLKWSYVISKKKALELFPMLKKDKLVGAIIYFDGMFSWCHVHAYEFQQFLFCQY